MKDKSKAAMTMRERTKQASKNQLSTSRQPWNQYIRVPKDMEMYVPKADEDSKKAILRVIAYKQTDPRNNPDCAEKGAWWWKRRFAVHKNVGPRKLTVCCPLHTFDKPCPICDEVSKMRRADDGEYSEEDIKSMDIKWQTAYFVMLKGEKKVRMFVMSSFCFDDKLTAEVDDEDNDGADALAEFKGGKYLRIRWAKAKFDKGSFVKVDSVSFIDAPDINESVSKGLDLDACLIETSAKDLAKMLEGTAASEDDDEKPAKGKKSKKSSKKDDDEDSDDSDDDSDGDDDEEDEDEKPKKGKKAPAKKGKAKKEEDDDDDASDDDDDSDGDDDDSDDDDASDDDDEDEKPAKGKKGAKKAPAKKAGKKKPSDDDDDDGDSDEDDSDEDDSDDDGDGDDDDSDDDSDDDADGDDDDSDSDDSDDDDSDGDDDDDASDDDDSDSDDSDDGDDDGDDDDSDDDDEDEKPKKGAKKAPAKKAGKKK